MKKQWIKQLAKSIFCFLLFYYSYLLQYIPVFLFHIKKITGTTGVLLSSFSNIILVIILFILYRKELIAEFKLFQNNREKDLDIGIKCWFVGLVIMMVSNLLINFFFHAGQANNEQQVQSMIHSLPWLMFLNAGIIGPFIEEIVFRKCFKNAIPNPWLFIISSGLVFGAMHVVTSGVGLPQLLYIIPYGALGAAFATAYQKTDTMFHHLLF